MMCSIRPSSLGLFSGFAMSCVASSILFSIFQPSSVCAISLPLKRTVTLALAVFQEAPHVLQLEVEVVLLGLRTHLDFLDLDGRLLLARFLEPPGLRVLVLAEVHDTAHRRRRIGRHLDEIELLLARGL